jgi:hypothetical protein
MSVRPSTIVLAAFVALAVAGIATATIPDGNGVIHACYAKKGGSLRVVDTGGGGTCTSKEADLAWGEQGPQGAQGPQGPQGPAVAPTVYETDSTPANSSDSLIYNSTYRDLASASLEAGSYVVWATAQVGTLGDLVLCDLTDGQTVLATARRGYPDADVLPLVAAAVLGSDATLTVRCKGANPNNQLAVGQWEWARIVVMPVGGVAS